MVEKSIEEGIHAPRDLLLVSRSSLEKKLANNSLFGFKDMKAIMVLRDKIQEQSHRIHSKDRSRSPYRSYVSKREDKGASDKTHRGNGKCAKLEYCEYTSKYEQRQITKNNDDTSSNPRSVQNNDTICKPALYAAVEEGEIEVVQELLLHDANTEETFQNWTPLMKAAEENKVEIIDMLLHNKANIEACNKKGRTALSFAAAPSGKRETAVEAIRYLLQNGADSKSQCQRGNTPKDYAMKEKRYEAVAVFEAFE